MAGPKVFRYYSEDWEGLVTPIYTFGVFPPGFMGMV